jgi:eukaryotic-like serine/threonine-protein kinase
MPLSVGDRLGPYEIVAPIGKGGMGEVYRAHDTRLRRDVALKVSVERFSERFEREAGAIATLNHPHICQIYNVGASPSGAGYLVMELIEGENLKGPLPLDTAVKYAGQIAEALEAAHEKGIVHRDLKPANIKITPAGSVKVLDFGLAKNTSGPAGGLTENSPTISMGMTQAGVILGTAAYMSPEQARGEPVDKRVDIWAFGVVFYEMLAGQRMYEGKTVSDVLAAVLIKEPVLSKIPRQVRKLLGRCLEKDPKKRLRDIADAMPLLEEEVAQGGGLPSQAQGLRRWLWPGIAAAAVMAAASLAAIDWLREPAKPAMVALTIPAPAGQRIVGAVVSPDGKQVALTAASPGSSAGILIRSMENPALRPVPGTQGITGPVLWSPDSRKLAFYQGGQIKTIDLATGSAQVLSGAERGQLSDSRCFRFPPPEDRPVSSCLSTTPARRTRSLLLSSCPAARGSCTTPRGERTPALISLRSTANSENSSRAVSSASTRNTPGPVNPIW